MYKGYFRTTCIKNIYLLNPSETYVNGNLKSLVSRKAAKFSEKFERCKMLTYYSSDESRYKNINAYDYRDI